MNFSFQLTGKIWLSVSIIILGYAFSTLVGAYYGLEAKQQLSTTNDVIFPATQLSNRALTNFRVQIQLYDDGFVLGDKDKITEARKVSRRVLKDLKALTLKPLAPKKLQGIQNIIQQIETFSTSAPRVYLQLIPDAMMDDDEEGLDQPTGDPPPEQLSETELTELTRALAEETAGLKRKLEALAQQFSDDLQNGLNEIITRDETRRQSSIILFVLVVLGSIIVISFVVRKFITLPLARTVTVLEDLSKGSLESRLGLDSNDEIGRMASAMDHFADSLTQKVSIAESIAAGDLTAEVTMASEGDTLGKAMRTMLNNLKANRAVIEDNIANLQRQALELKSTNDDLVREVTERKQAEEKLAATQQQLIETSRQAGMAEIATGVLHNVGNVLNSVNVSATLVANQVNNSQAAGLEKATELINSHQDSLSAFFQEDPRGKQLPKYLTLLSQHLLKEREEVSTEISSLLKNISHIKEIVSLQQSYAKISGVREMLQVEDLMEDAIRINKARISENNIEVSQHYTPMDLVGIDRQKVLQILVNLIKNAADALKESGIIPAVITVRTSLLDDNRVRMEVADNGVGISEENLTRIFAHGFTTKKEGHGFGLHSGALAAKELGGSLVAESDGQGEGSTFILELPYSEEQEA
jgi:signal transduction histidine kinase